MVYFSNLDESVDKTKMDNFGFSIMFPKVSIYEVTNVKNLYEILDVALREQMLLNCR